MRGFRRFFSRWQNWLGIVLILFFVVVAIAAPLLSPMDAKNPSVLQVVGNSRDFTPHAPSTAEPFGTMSRQLSVYHAVIWGSRSALIFGLSIALFAMLIGVLVGTLSAVSGGFLHNLIMRITDTFLAFPIIAAVVLITQLFTILLSNAGAMYMMGGMGASIFASTGKVYLPDQLPAWLVFLNSLDPVMIAFILFSWMPYARVMDTTITRVRQNEYVEAAQVVGAKKIRIIFRHILPNAISPAIVLAAKDVGGMVLLQATFTFIGIGQGSAWGQILVLSKDWIISAGGLFGYWWTFVPATLALILFGIGWNLIGDGLNEALNPRSTNFDL
ncbi:MAG: ABC transporter permease [Anaerolineaceae bacterium]|nr:ABC transporter permease [Anaerolineaceae bacterium]